jgi:hypothetical protein
MAQGLESRKLARSRLCLILRIEVRGAGKIRQVENMMFCRRGYSPAAYEMQGAIRRGPGTEVYSVARHHAGDHNPAGIGHTLAENGQESVPESRGVSRH